MERNFIFLTQGYDARSAENKRRMESNPRDNHGQQPLSKRQNVSGYHHVGPCTVKCNNYKRVGHQTRDCRSTTAVPNTQRAPFGNQQGVICYEYGRPRHVKRECPKLRNQNHRNQLGTRLETRLEVTKLQQRLTPLMEDKQTLIPIALLDVAPSTLDTSYAVELADGRTSETNVVLRGCTLGLLGHPFDIDLMPVELGSFDVIIGMDWLAKYHALIVCDEKVIRIPYRDEVLIIRGDNCDGRSKLNIISCTRTQKYIQKGCQVYLAQVTSKKAEDKSEKRLEDVPIVQVKFPESFQKNLAGRHLFSLPTSKFPIDFKPIPTFEDRRLVRSHLKGQVYSKIDLNLVIINIRVREEDIPKLALGLAMDTTVPSNGRIGLLTPPAVFLD
ncbi:putative reverse transcriptase domain-containing protein [Tanacetum coccineum]